MRCTFIKMFSVSICFSLFIKLNMKINFPCNYFHIPVHTYKNNNIKNIVKKKKVVYFRKQIIYLKRVYV